MDPPAVPPHIDDHALGTLRSVLFLREPHLVSAVPAIPSALILLGVIGYLIYVGGLLSPAAYNRNDYYQQGYGQGYGNQGYQAR